MLTSLKTLCALLAVVSVAVSCGRDSTAPVPGKPAAVRIVSGDTQSARVGTELADPVVVRVIDDAGNPVPGQLINFKVVSGNGSVFAGSSITNANGEARERWTLGTNTAEEQKLEARAVDATTGDPIVFATFHATPLPGPAASMRKASDDNAGGTVGQPAAVPPVVEVVDQYGNPVSGTPVTFTVLSGGGSINGGNETSVVTNASGVATATGWVLGPSVGSNALSASVAGLTGSPLTFLATANVGPIATITVTPSDVSFVSYNQQLTAIAKDANGNVVGNPSLTWSSSNQSVATVDAQGLVTAISDGDATITAAGNGQTGAANVHVLPWTISAITTAARHTCALTGTDHTAYCWGISDYGALGNGTETFSHVASAVQNKTTFNNIAAGVAETCGVGTDATTYCWGLWAPSPRIGQIHSDSPAGMANGLVTVSTGGGSACGLSASGAAKCWGYNQFGELGDGTTTDALPAVAVSGGLQFSSISVNDATCAVSVSAAGYCWGDNRFGQIGDGTTTQRTTPTLVQGGLAFNTITTSGSHSCGLTAGGAAYCWGNNDQGQLGDGTTTGDPNSTGRSTPAPVSGNFVFDSISAGAAYTCALTGSGAAYCWGNNDYGQLGDGTVTQRLTPVAVQGSFLFTSISAGAGTTCGVTASGKAYCWGLNDWGQIGDGTVSKRLFPNPVRRP